VPAEVSEFNSDVPSRVFIEIERTVDFDTSTVRFKFDRKVRFNAGFGTGRSRGNLQGDL
jgi:hypothetical protein